jgi:hypothetical protein
MSEQFSQVLRIGKCAHLLPIYEKQFYKMATREKLMKEDVSLFLKNCDLHPTDKDIATAFNTIFKGNHVSF